MSLVTRGLGDVYLITQGYGIFEEEIVGAILVITGGSGAGARKKRKLGEPTEEELYFQGLREKIMLTGVRINTSAPYDPVSNPRRDVSPETADKIARNMMASRVGR